MEHTVVGVFDSNGAAEAARQDMIAAGIPGGRVRVASGIVDSPPETRRLDSGERAGFMGWMRGVFTGSGQHYDEYVEAAHRGHCMLVVEAADEAQRDRIADAMMRSGAIDIDRHVASWQQQGWQTGSGMDRDPLAVEQQAAGRVHTLGGVRSYARETAGPGAATDRDATYGTRAHAMDVDELNKVLRDELSAIETYRQALEKNRAEYGADGRVRQLQQMLGDHEEAAAQLRDMIRRLGGTASNDSGAWGTWASTVMGTAKLFGDKSALKALKEGEESGIKDYQAVLQDRVPPADVADAFQAIVSKEQEHVRQLDLLIEQAA